MSLIWGIIDTYKKYPSLLVITIILAIIALLLEIYYPRLRGFMGEFWVKRELKKLPKNKYNVINNVMIKDERGTHQIDHIVLCSFGIFVIEMKNYYGKIYGKEFDSKWIQYTKKRKTYFNNPIHQNYGHIKTLVNLLGLDENKFISIICFSNQVKLKVQSKSVVTQLDYLKGVILKYQDVIIEDDINVLYNTIITNNIVDKNSKNEHIKDIKNKIDYSMNLENNMICPKCGSELKEKMGKYGKFIGCTNYPKCKYIKR